MFDFWKFYRGLFARTNFFDFFDNYWEQFPKGPPLRFKKETLLLLNDAIEKKDAVCLTHTIAIILLDGADKVVH